LGRALTQQLKIETMVADAGFDSAFNHRLHCETHGIRSTIPPEYSRPPKDPAAVRTDKYRRLMKRRFNSRAYRFRAQVETVMSMLKRNLGAALSAKTYQGRCRELMLRVLSKRPTDPTLGAAHCPAGGAGPANPSR
jgi:hypothetical protein